MTFDPNTVKRNWSRRILQATDKFRGEPFSQMERVRQNTVAHCGPAVIEMLVSYLGKKTNQDKVVLKIGTSTTWFKLYGVNVPELARAVEKLFPDFEFWYKKESTITDLSKIINFYKYPVGIEWQGVFDYDDTDFDPSYGEEDDDPGHYSAVTAIDTKKNFMRIADPERHYAGHDRQFSISFFKNRWWDTNEVRIKSSKKTKKIKDNRMMFIIVPKTEKFPRTLGMIRL